MIEQYEESVYAGVLGKVVGVYLGRPFEGWTKDKIEEKWGKIVRYVHEDRNVPLVVSDDDITGTLTFVRALEDSGLYADTTAEFFGSTWMNYTIEGKTIFWWGGMGVSTEHTAYLRLKQSIKAPNSGSMALNGKVVAEQIGAQIFIDAFGLVAPGKPELAADLARKAASVSHDGEAVHAAVVVAGMVAAAFVEKDMERLLDTGVGLIPADSLIARIHKDVRRWAREDNDWRKTYERINSEYGYAKYGGGCHVVPNHAIMVMAWVYAPDNFHESQAIINTAGWDTDCNAANVGCVMGVKVGLKGINAQYDFQSPFADRILLPTAEGSASVSDCLAEALRIARIGRRVMGWPAVESPKDGAWMHFSQAGALHGFMSEDSNFESRSAARASNIPSATGNRAMAIDFDVGVGRTARVSTPISCPPVDTGYAVIGTPKIYSGQSVEAHVSVSGLAGRPTARLFVRHAASESKGGRAVAYGAIVELAEGADVTLRLDVPDTGGWPVYDLGVELSCGTHASGRLLVDRLTLSGAPNLFFPIGIPHDAKRHPLGWIIDGEVLPWGPAYDSDSACLKPTDSVTLFKNVGRGFLVTGNMDWTDYTVEALFSVHMPGEAGVVARYQGLDRHLKAVKTPDSIRLVLRHYEDEILGEAPSRWELDELHRVSIECRGERVRVIVDGVPVIEATDRKLGRGGAGMSMDSCRFGLRSIQIQG